MERRAATQLMLGWPHGAVGKVATGAGRGAAIVLLLVLAVDHLTLAPLYYEGTSYIGILFYLAGAGALVAAVAIAIGVRGAWSLGALVAGGSFGGLVLSATVGLPGFMDSLAAPRAMRSLVVEGSYVALFAVASALRRTSMRARVVVAD